jgi:hypothetical protein
MKLIYMIIIELIERLASKLLLFPFIQAYYAQASSTDVRSNAKLLGWSI